ncbi:MAG TPA: EamA family transporter [Planctomycetota bacterium]|jgi:drug/metabolite transporter (DMT)-like permease|nr:EamA family transporter [Planctomycetota bacterium]OQC21692.1 MAG: EamA-like transporter family protein [Planctomycetes bacterium ADurb.Bin069]HNR98928.1 EamA family transporter [Planctomycetota bacterium]HNU25997.1 EamA family transporter [Planctomycetota bacterium]HOE29662.1 EamA family transporter [Planctomycetota bacterium]
MVLAFVQSPPPFPLAGEAAALAAAFIWALTVCVYKRWGAGIPPQLLNYFKCAVAAACFAAAAAALRPAPPADAWDWVLLALSGAVGLAIGDTAFFAALARLGAQATSIGWCMSPAFAAVIAWPALGETLNAAEGTGIALTIGGVCGAILFGTAADSPHASPGRRVAAAGAAYVALSALCQGVGLVLQRDAFQGNDPLLGALIRLVPAVALLGALHGARPPAMRFRDLFAPRRRALALMTAAVLGTFGGVFLQSFSAKYAKAGVTGALLATFPLWVIPIARIWLKERTNWRTILCTLLAFAAVCLLLAAGNL